MSTAQRAAPLGVAIIGCGRIGELRGQIAAAHPCVSFMACADRDGTRAAQVAQQLGAQFHGADNLAAISRPEVSAVIVSSAEDAHVEPVLQALALWKLRGGWRKAAIVILVLMLPVFGHALFALAAGSNLWPIALIFVCPIACFYLFGLFLVKWVRAPAAA